MSITPPPLPSQRKSPLEVMIARKAERDVIRSAIVKALRRGATTEEINALLIADTRADENFRTAIYEQLAFEVDQVFRDPPTLPAVAVAFPKAA